MHLSIGKIIDVFEQFINQPEIHDLSIKKIIIFKLIKLQLFKLI